MRDIERIDKICSQLAEVWKKVPDWRLTQLIDNFQAYQGSDCYYMEDDKFITKIEEYLNGVISK